MLESFQKWTNVLIADDHAVLREYTCQLVKEVIPFAKIIEAWDFHSIMEIARMHDLSLIICDIHMPDCNIFQLVEQIKALHPKAKIIIFTAYNLDLYANKLIQLGVDAFINKEATGTIVKETINKVHTGILEADTRYPKSIMLRGKNNNNDANPLIRLSEREFEIAQMMTRGLGGLEICNALNLHKATVSTYKRRIYKKLKISSLLELASIFNLHSGNYI